MDTQTGGPPWLANSTRLSLEAEANLIKYNGIDPSMYVDGDVDKLDGMIEEANAECSKRLSEHASATEDLARLNQFIIEQSAKAESASCTLAQRRLASWDEFCDHPKDCDSAALSQALGPLESEVSFVQDCLDLVRHVRLWDAQERVLTAELSQREIEHLQASLRASRQYAETLEKLRSSGLLEAEGEVSLTGAKTTRARLACEEAHRKLMAAQEALTEFKKRRATAEVQRMGGKFSRAEATSGAVRRKLGQKS